MRLFHWSITIILLLAVFWLNEDMQRYQQADMSLGYEVMEFIPAQVRMNEVTMGIILQLNDRLTYLEKYDTD